VRLPAACMPISISTVILITTAAATLTVTVTLGQLGARAVVAQPLAPTVVAVDDPALNARYQRFIQEVRCLICAGRSIAESPAGIAQDLKRVILEMMQAGADDAEIAAFLADRYGDSILYRPPLQANTWPLWFGPACFLLIGAIIFAKLVHSGPDSR
jgi:cytochrome c-type biogenesis protein CcmH